jgi:hypothetical protein
MCCPRQGAGVSSSATYCAILASELIRGPLFILHIGLYSGLTAVPHRRMTFVECQARRIAIDDAQRFPQCQGWCNQEVDHRGYCQDQSRWSGCCATREIGRVTSNSTIVQCHAVLLRRVPIDGVGGIQFEDCKLQAVNPCAAVFRLPRMIRDVEIDFLTDIARRCHRIGARVRM